MPDRTINWGDPADAGTKYRTQDDDPAGGGNFVVAEDTDNNTVLLQYNLTASQWEYAGPVDMGGNDISNVGTISADSLKAGSVNNTNLADDVNYIDPRWLARGAYFLDFTGHTLDGVFDGSSGGSISIDTTQGTAVIDSGSTSGDSGKVRFIEKSGLGYIDINATTKGTLSIGFDVADSATDRTDYATVGNVVSGGKGFGLKISNGDLLLVSSDQNGESTNSINSNISTGAYQARVEWDGSTVTAFDRQDNQTAQVTNNIPNSPSDDALVLSTQTNTSAQRRLNVGRATVVLIP